MSTNKNDKNEIKWQQFYKELTAYSQDVGHCNVPKSFSQNGHPLGRWVSTQRQARKKGNLSEDRKKLLDAVGFTWDNGNAASSLARDRLWTQRYEELETYQLFHGNCNVPRNYKNIPELARWVDNQRRLQRKNELSDHRKDLLDLIGFTWEVLMDAWQQRYQELKAFHLEHGHSDIPKNYSNNPALAKWAGHQREAMRNNKMPTDRKQLLDDIGFTFQFKTPSVEWKKRYEELRAYKIQHGHCKVSRRSEEYSKLAEWAKAQKRRTSMPKAQRAPLERIGFGLPERKEAAKQPARKTTTLSTPPHTRVIANNAQPAEETSPPPPLPTAQRNVADIDVPAEKCSTPTPAEKALIIDVVVNNTNNTTMERIATSEQPAANDPPPPQRWEFPTPAIPNPPMDNENENFEEVRGEQPSNPSSTIRVPLLPPIQTAEMIVNDNYSEGGEEIPVPMPPRKISTRAAKATTTQAAKGTKTPTAKAKKPPAAKSKPTPAKAKKPPTKATNTATAKATKPPAKKGVREIQWQERYEELKVYQRKHGNTNVPRGSTDHRLLAQWVRNQRLEGSRGIIKDHRKQQLNAIGFTWVLSMHVDWQQRYEELKAYKQINGHCNVPRGYKSITRLDIWVTDQRQEWKKGKMRMERQHLLEQIGFQFEPLKDSWNMHYEMLKAFQMARGHCNVSSRDGQEFPGLMEWVAWQRRRKNVSADQKELLEEIGFDLRPKNAQHDDVVMESSPWV